MSYARPFIRLSFGGTLASGGDIWSCNLHLVQTGASMDFQEWFANVQPLITDYSSLLEDYVNATETKVPFDVKHNWTKMALIGTDGTYIAEPVEVQAFGAGLNNVAYIPQCSVVNGLVSEKWKDPGRYNRFYLPVSGPSSAGVWHLDSTEQAAYTGRLKQLITDINDVYNLSVEGTGAAVGVVSNSGSGSESSVAAVRIGRIIDTQRRRRNSLTEDYVVLPMVP